MRRVSARRITPVSEIAEIVIEQPQIAHPTRTSQHPAVITRDTRNPIITAMRHVSHQTPHQQAGNPPTTACRAHRSNQD